MRMMILSDGAPAIRGEIACVMFRPPKAVISSIDLIIREGNCSQQYRFDTTKDLYHYCRKHNFDILDERTNVERYIQDGRLL